MDQQKVADDARHPHRQQAEGRQTAAAQGALIVRRVKQPHQHDVSSFRPSRRVLNQDEREKSIVNQSFQFAGMFTFFAAAASQAHRQGLPRLRPDPDVHPDPVQGDAVLQPLHPAQDGARQPQMPPRWRG